MYRSHGASQQFVDRTMADQQRALRVEAPTRAAAPPEPSKLRKEGEFWTISYQGATFRLKDIKGFAYLAHLLAHPGEHYHSKDLVTIVEGASVGKTMATGAVDANLTIATDLDGAPVRNDTRARTEYRERISELKSDLDNAEQANDIGRVERLREELEFLTEELASSSGIRGRARQSSSHAERARVMVAKNIRTAIEKIREQSAQLGRHLAISIRTGYFCSYEPDPDHPLTWQL